MHTTKVLLHKHLCQSVPSIHASRLKALLQVVQSVALGARATVTSMGRGLCGSAYDKHMILKGLSEVVICIDWSPLCADQSRHLLRAAIPFGGRSLTLYEEVHPKKHLGNRKVQHRFLDQLALMLPDTCQPIIVADSGFRTPFYRYVET